MSATIGRESFFWHKLHSLTGVIPVGYYLVQHLTLNSFSLAGPSKFNAILAFFEAMPVHFLYALKAIAIWIPLIFHAVYGIFIVNRAQPNLAQAHYRFRENRYYTFQRWSGIVLFIFLCYHMGTTSVAGSIAGSSVRVNGYEGWVERLSAPYIGNSPTYLVLLVYIVGVVLASYHLAYGLWSFCIRWGITISERSQGAMWKFSKMFFVGLSAVGILALLGFFYPILGRSETAGLGSAVQVKRQSDASPAPTLANR